ncbi:hypothetical protein [Burkholderia stabilis]|uniref:hypothetical protein n=1 Tax=Burkholderia stabilis TaxID=95485 RepID=UPI00159014AB|nr:hypothetical protein [Burkholderia stabilis]
METREAGTAPRATPRSFRLPHWSAKYAPIKLLLIVFIAVFPDWLIDEVVAPHLCCFISTARRCAEYRKQRATRYSTVHCARRTAAAPARIAGNVIFCFRNVSRQRFGTRGDR